MNTHDEMLGEFERLHPTLEACAARLRDDLEHRLRARGVAAQLVSVRVKSPASVRHKLARPERTYASLWSVTDLVGLRVTVYFEDAIEVAARLVEEAVFRLPARWRRSWYTPVVMLAMSWRMRTWKRSLQQGSDWVSIPSLAPRALCGRPWGARWP